MTDTNLLEVAGIECSYGRIRAVHGVSLTVQEGEIVSLIGANGAGKTTVLRAISGLVNPSRGAITFEGRAINDMEAEEIVRLGIAHVPEGRRIFPGLTVLENLEVAAAWRRLPRRQLQERIEHVFDLFPNLRRRSGSRGWSLSGGEQQMLALGRAVVTSPKLLLLDEPSLGLAPNLVQQMFQRVREINREGAAVLLVEQNVYLAMEVSTRAYVIENGEVAMNGPSAELAGDSRVRARYLG
jgi:branched-chain amino acid transport system ATP-binding protein